MQAAVAYKCVNLDAAYCLDDADASLACRILTLLAAVHRDAKGLSLPEVAKVLHIDSDEYLSRHLCAQDVHALWATQDPAAEPGFALKLATSTRA